MLSQKPDWLISNINPMNHLYAFFIEMAHFCQLHFLSKILFVVKYSKTEGERKRKKNDPPQDVDKC